MKQPTRRNGLDEVRLAARRTAGAASTVNLNAVKRHQPRHRLADAFLASLPLMAETPSGFLIRRVSPACEAGAVFFGKTTTPEYWKGITHGPLTGITRNPEPGQDAGWFEWWRGGRGGNRRLPAARHRRRWRWLDSHPRRLHRPVRAEDDLRAWCAQFRPFARHARRLGGLTRTVEDSALMLEVIGRPDTRDAFAVSRSRRSTTANHFGRARLGPAHAYARDLIS